MEWKTIGTLALLVTAGGAAEAKAQGAHLVVRIFNNYEVSAGDLREAKAHAAAILQTAGIAVTWLDCWYGKKAPLDAPARCRDSVGSDLVLRLQRTQAGNGERFVSLGFSLVVREGLPFLATVYADLAETVARRAGVGSRTLLGRAIAHEIGHLLLNSNSHSDAGVMRAAWSRVTLRRDDARDWQFRESEVETMRSAIAARMDVRP
jgi:hypothetical protein